MGIKVVGVGINFCGFVSVCYGFFLFYGSFIMVGLKIDIRKVLRFCFFSGIKKFVVVV